MSWQVHVKSTNKPLPGHDSIRHTPTPTWGASLRICGTDWRVVRVVRSIVDEKNWNKHEAPASSSYLDLVYVELDL